MTREDLKDYAKNKDTIDLMIRELNEYRESIKEIKHILSDMPKSSKITYDSIGEKIANLIEKEEEYINLICEEKIASINIINQLKLVQQPYRLLLYKKYIENKSLVVVASEMKFSYEYTKKMHGIALNVFDNIDKKYSKSHKVTKKHQEGTKKY